MNAEHGPLPVVVGVTGHRDLPPEDEPRLRSCIRHILEDLQRQYPHTPLIVLSGLAAGADQLGAEVALEMKLRLIAVLPMPLDMYEPDFLDAQAEDPRALGRFRDLLRQAAPCIELPLEAERARVEQTGDERDAQYAALARYLVQHSQILIALWDGRDTYRTGGTANVVRFQRQGIKTSGPGFSHLDALENGPVQQIVTRRKSSPAPYGVPFEVHELPPTDSFGNTHDSDTSYARILEKTDEFNKAAVSLSGNLAADRKRSRSYILGSAQDADLPVESATVLDLYVHADSLAQYFQGKSNRMVLGIFFLAAVSAAAFSVFAHMARGSVVFLLPYVIVLGIAVIWHVIPERSRSREKYLDYRALAEALRVQFFWQVAGLKDAVADHYIRKHRGELRWIRNALRASLLPLANAQTGSPCSPADGRASVREPDYDLVTRLWVKDQQRYFETAANRHNRYVRRAGIATLLCLLIAATLAVLILAWFAPGLYAHPPELDSTASEFKKFFEGGVASGGAETSVQKPTGAAETPPLLEALILLTTLFVVGAATAGSFADTKAWEDQAKQYARMHEHYTRALKWLESGLDESETRSLLVELGREALGENGDWVILRRSRVEELTPGG